MGGDKPGWLSRPIIPGGVVGPALEAISELGSMLSNAFGSVSESISGLGGSLGGISFGLGGGSNTAETGAAIAQQVSEPVIAPANPLAEMIALAAQGKYANVCPANMNDLGQFVPSAGGCKGPTQSAGIGAA